MTDSGPSGGRLAVVTEHRFGRSPDGRWWTPDTYAYSYFRQYLGAFAEVLVVARAAPVDGPPAGWLRVDGPGVAGCPVPPYLGPVGLATRWFAVRAALRRAVAASDVVLLRTPGALSNLAFPLAQDRGVTCAVHVVGDPGQVFAPGGVGGPLRRPLRWWFTRELRRQCQGADFAYYVTRRHLQDRYPPGAATRAGEWPNAQLPDDAFADGAPGVGPPWRLVTVGSLEQPYKGVDVLLGALGLLDPAVGPVDLEVIGDGRHRAELEAQAAAAGLAGRVSFSGRLAGPAAVRQHLRHAHVFVLASRTEGLPRALIEAMALGLPCAATAVGGIPELLDPDALVPPDDAPALAAVLSRLLGDASWRQAQAGRNLERARAYSSERQARAQRAILHTLAESVPA